MEYILQLPSIIAYLIIAFSLSGLILIVLFLLTKDRPDDLEDWEYREFIAEMARKGHIKAKKQVSCKNEKAR